MERAECRAYGARQAMGGGEISKSFESVWGSPRLPSPSDNANMDVDVNRVDNACPKIGVNPNRTSATNGGARQARNPKRPISILMGDHDIENRLSRPKAPINQPHRAKNRPSAMRGDSLWNEPNVVRMGRDRRWAAVRFPEF